MSDQLINNGRRQMETIYGLGHLGNCLFRSDLLATHNVSYFLDLKLRCYAALEVVLASVIFNACTNRVHVTHGAMKQDFCPGSSVQYILCANAS